MVGDDVMRCFAYSALSYNGFGPSRTFQEVIRSFDKEKVRVTAFSPRLRVKPDNDAEQVQGLPMPFRYLPWKYVARQAASYTESRLLSRVLREKSSRFVYTSPDMSIGTSRRLTESGTPLIREMTNLHRGMAQRILSEAYAVEGLPAFTGIDPDSVEVESRCLDYADHVFAPNAEVAKSLVEFGVRPERILDTSYGWSRFRYSAIDRVRADERSGGVVALFVGRVSYDKGVHHLLRAWHRAGCLGKLVLAGATQPLLEERMGEELNHPSIVRLGFVDDMSATYASADYLVFPSLVEGGPQVVYEAAAHGLALIVSPMGAGRMVPDADHGIVVEPGDIDGFAAAITRFAENLALTREIGENARKRAEQFEWSEVSRERARLILGALHAR